MVNEKLVRHASFIMTNILQSSIRSKLTSKHFPSGLKEVPEDIPDDTILLDLQNNKIAEIKENDFKNLKGLQVRPSHLPSYSSVLFLKIGQGFCNYTVTVP